MVRMSWPSSTRLALVVCLGLFLLLPTLLAQTVSGTIQGTVTDTSGAPLPGVTVTVRSMETGFQRVVLTNPNGHYVVPFIPVGKYRVVAELSGMNRMEKTNVDVGLNHTRVVDLQLGVATVAETITVVAEQPRINKVNAEVKQTLVAEQIIDKPSSAPAGPTAFLDLATTFAGYNENPTSGQNNPTLSSGSSINFGAGTRGATFQINGVNNDDSSENQHRQGVALSTIKEFQILSNNYSAEFGRAYGAVVLVHTKSGTNDVSGDLYGFYNDADWNAKSYFFRNSPKPVQTKETYGVTAGFPIIRDRLFGYGSAEFNGLKGEFNRAVDILTPEILSLPRLTQGNDNPANRAWLESIIARYPAANPNRPDLSPMAYEPGALNRDWPDGDYTFRLDYDPNQKHHLWTRYQSSDQQRETDDIVVGENAIQDNKQWNVGFTWSQVFTDSVFGEFRYGLGYRDTNVNINSGNDTPIVRFTGSPYSGTILGNAGAFPIQREQTDHQFVYNVNALLWENHSLKVGTDVRMMELNDLADNYSRGFWRFRPQCNGMTYPGPYHAMMDGCVWQFWKGYGNFYLENEMDEVNLYAEDNWQILSNLTLNLGVRYEFVGAPTEKQDRLDYMYDDSDYVDPRLGFAWTITNDSPTLNWLTGGPGRAVIRGGYGTYHGRVFQSIFSQGGANVRFNPPNAIFIVFPDSFNLADPSEGYQFVPGEPINRRISIVTIDEDLVMPQTDQWNLTFERELPWDSALRISYVNKKGSDLIRYWNDNLPLSPLDGPVTVVDHPFNAPAAGHPDLRGRTIDRVNPDPCAGTGLPGVPTNAQCPNPVPLGDNEISARVPRINERRPDPRYTTNIHVNNLGESDYEAVQIEWNKRFSNNLHFQTSYTYSEYFDNVSEATFVGSGDTNFTGPNKKFAWGRSRFDTPHRFTFYGSYRLPFFEDRKDWVGLLLGGWQIAPVIKYASGTPFTVVDSGGLDLDFNGFTEGRPVILDPSLQGRTIGDPETSQSRLPRDAFRRATFGDSIEDLVERNSFRTDNLETIDLGVYKSFDLPYGASLMLRLEAFNITDEVQFGFPINDIANANFGRITSTAANYSPRVFQVGLRLLY